MRPMRIFGLRWIMWPALAALLNACITINIYFPAAAAEKAADKVIDEIWQTLPDGSTSQPKVNVRPKDSTQPTNNTQPMPEASAPAATTTQDRNQSEQGGQP